MNDRFLRACRREPVDCTPVWMMRQAGRYMPEYRALRAKHTMLEVCKTPELALEVTLQPLKFGMDAAILFADILLPLEPMGAPFDFQKGEGPVIFSPVANKADVDKLHDFEIEEGLGYCLEAIKLLKKELKVPLIGFAGAPFTLASYLIEGGKSSAFAKAKRFMYAEPETFSALMAKLAEVVRRFLHKQIDAGVDAVQLFDSWVGQLSAEDYRTYVMPHVQHILKDIEKRGVPSSTSGRARFTFSRSCEKQAVRSSGSTGGRPCRSAGTRSAGIAPFRATSTPSHFSPRASSPRSTRSASSMRSATRQVTSSTSATASSRRRPPRRSRP